MIGYAFHPEAESDLDAAMDYYESCAVGLGLDFALEVHTAIQRICEHPKAWPVLEGEVHRCQTRRFPYGILYAVERDSVIILAVMHLHRKPAY